MAVHLRDPGDEKTEDIITTTRLAVKGGVGNMVAMPDTVPCTDVDGIYDYIVSKSSRWGFCDIIPALPITKGNMGKEISDFGEAEKGRVYSHSSAYSGNNISNAVLYTALDELSKSDRTVILDCNDSEFSKDGVINPCKYARIQKLATIPPSAQDSAVAVALICAEHTGAKIHITGLSTKLSVELVRKAKQRGVKVTADTYPIYFTHCDHDIIYCGTNLKVIPPVRTKEDTKAILEGIADGTIDCIASGHRPKKNVSADFNICDFGMSGLSTLFGASYTHLVRTRIIDLYRLVEMLTVNPIEILSLDRKGELTPDAEADFSIISLDSEVFVNEKFLTPGRGDNPYNGMILNAGIDEVFLKGKAVLN